MIPLSFMRMRLQVAAAGKLGLTQHLGTPQTLSKMTRPVVAVDKNKHYATHTDNSSKGNRKPAGPLTYMLGMTVADAIGGAYQFSEQSKKQQAIAVAEKANKETSETIKKFISEYMQGDSVSIYASYIPRNGEPQELFSLNPTTSFPMASIYKLPIIIYCLHLVEAKQLKLNTEYEICSEDDRKEWNERNPATFLKVGDKVTLQTLLLDMIKYSGGVATDKVLKIVGGPKQVTQYLKATIGINEIEVTRTIEEAFSAMGIRMDGQKTNAINLEAIDDGVSDRSTAKAVDLLFRKLLTGKILNEEHVNLILNMMTKSLTLKAKADPYIEESCTLGNKTGSVSGVLNHSVIVIQPKNSHDKLIVTTLIKHSGLRKPGKEISFPERATRMSEGAKLTSAAVNSIYKIAAPLIRNHHTPKILVEAQVDAPVPFTESNFNSKSKL